MKCLLSNLILNAGAEAREGSGSGTEALTPSEAATVPPDAGKSLKLDQSAESGHPCTCHDAAACIAGQSGRRPSNVVRTGPSATLNGPGGRPMMQDRDPRRNGMDFGAPPRPEPLDERLLSAVTLAASEQLRAAVVHLQSVTLPAMARAVTSLRDAAIAQPMVARDIRVCC